MDIKIGDQFDIKNINLESDFATGIVLDKNIAYNGRYLRFIVNNEERYRSPYKVINNKFAIECKDSVGIAKFDINLANGKYIFIENCGIAGSLEVKQYKKRPILE